MFKKINEILTLKIQILTKQLLELNKTDAKMQWDLETGKMFNDLIGRYPISEEELLSMSETVCKFTMYTRKTNIDNYLFLDKELTRPRRLN